MRLLHHKKSDLTDLAKTRFLTGVPSMKSLKRHTTTITNTRRWTRVYRFMNGYIFGSRIPKETLLTTY